jgi:hypothetical protein
LAIPGDFQFELIGKVNIRNLSRNRVGTDPVKIAQTDDREFLLWEAQ